MLRRGQVQRPASAHARPDLARAIGFGGPCSQATHDEPTSAPRLTWLYEPGRLPYRHAWALQHALVEKRIAREIPDTLLLLEHEPVITLGRRADPANILADDATLQAAGVEVVPVERGGDVTYHGQGQLVGYPIMHLPGLGFGASDFMHALEEALMQALSGYGLATQRRPGVIGVWVDGQQDRRPGPAHSPRRHLSRPCAQRGPQHGALEPDRALWHPRRRRDQPGRRVGLCPRSGRGARVRRHAPGAVLGLALQTTTASELRAAGVDAALL